jgi:hypothetical protein
MRGSVALLFADCTTPLENFFNLQGEVQKLLQDYHASLSNSIIRALDQLQELESIDIISFDKEVHKTYQVVLFNDATCYVHYLHQSTNKCIIGHPFHIQLTVQDFSYLLDNTLVDNKIYNVKELLYPLNKQVVNVKELNNTFRILYPDCQAIFGAQQLFLLFVRNPHLINEEDSKILANLRDYTYEEEQPYLLNKVVASSDHPWLQLLPLYQEYEEDIINIQINDYQIIAHLVNNDIIYCIL